MKVSEYIDHVYPGADTRRYINKVCYLDGFGTLYLILFTALPFLSCYGIRISCAWPWFQEPSSCLSGWFTISEKKFVPFVWINVIQEYSRSNHVLFCTSLVWNGPHLAANSYPLVLDARVHWNLTIPLIKFVFSRSRMDRILLLPQYSPQLRYFLHRQDLLETDVLSILIRSNRFRLIWLCASSASGHRMAEWGPLFLYSLFGDGISKGPPPSKNWYGSGWKPSLLTRYKNDDQLHRVHRWSWLYL